ncbi:MAG: hypothetical protein ACK4UT_06760, partial [Moraxellaceae bacterium]
MDKQQGQLAALGGIIVVGAAAFFWVTRGDDAPAPAPTPAPAAAITPQVSAPLSNGSGTAAPSPVSDAVALSEEPIDQYLQEAAELNSRAADLEEQARDGAELIALKEKQIRELEAQLKALEAGK